MASGECSVALLYRTDWEYFVPLKPKLRQHGLSVPSASRSTGRISHEYRSSFTCCLGFKQHPSAKTAMDSAKEFVMAVKCTTSRTDWGELVLVAQELMLE